MLHVQRPKELLLKAAQWFSAGMLVELQNLILIEMVVAPEEENMQIICQFVVPSLSYTFKEEDRNWEEKEHA